MFSLCFIHKNENSWECSRISYTKFYSFNSNFTKICLAYIEIFVWSSWIECWYIIWI